MISVLAKENRVKQGEIIFSHLGRGILLPLRDNDRMGTHISRFAGHPAGSTRGLKTMA